MFDYKESDCQAIELYNNRRKQDSPTRLQVKMGAAPFDGDPFAAKVVLLLNNPTYTPDSVPEDHKLKFEDWPLDGLHPSVREGFRQWYSRPLGFLIRKFGAKSVSQRVAIVQIVPWASRSFDLACVLPSRERQVKIAKEAVQRGSIVIIGRSIPFWSGRLGEAGNIYKATNVRNPAISPSGLRMEEKVFDTLFSKALLG